jgi:3-phosphoshikimate 1-carboxyvinyltransferase
MEFCVEPSTLHGTVTIPGSKSHTIRALVAAALADGRSTIQRPLISADTRSCLRGCQAFGAQFTDLGDAWQIEGTAGRPRPPRDIVDCGNSGTSVNFLTGTAALVAGATILTGDAQIRRRPNQPLLDALTQLGATAISAPQTGCPPLVVRGPLKGGYAEVRATISQYVSSLLLNCPLAPADTEIRAIDLGEKPYVEMTLSWLDRLQIQYEQHDLERFFIKGGQAFRAFEAAIPADFSSATFFICAAAIPGCEIVLKGLDFDDPQGDKQIVDVLEMMGADIRPTADGLYICGTQLEGREIDLGDMPDALPALAVVGCLAQGTTQIRNVAHARLKETDRIAVMCTELQKMGAAIAEQPDGLTIETSRLRGQTVCSHHDHRVAMALTMAGLAAQGATRIPDADAVEITFPEFPQLLTALGASLKVTSA